MNIEALIAAKKAERTAKGFAFRITFDKRAPFNGYYVDKATFDENYALAVASIGKRGRDGMTALSVEVIQ
ncbi:hypothetical protein LH464_21410 [Neorhizobium sp. T786]|uniref:hypothetical protein n=1 Tax=Pseudorhizobium xiangyangii TaxID=2883104 RepID=UPI001CFF6662|nr:hypothetical protein [Neorhizobium xiangyangii]MCB5205028.1 hypothetical protein [Neorhizobium xiangyangii]